MIDVIAACRSCGAQEMETVLALGNMPLADALLHRDQLMRPEPRYPLTVVLCSECGLMQLRETVSPEELFCHEYPYFSSFSPSLLEHSRDNVEELIAERGLDGRHRVVEIASNDGYLLQYYAAHGIPVLGIDPAEGPTRSAKERGIPTLCTFFTADLARSFRDDGKLADVIHANNVLAQVPDLNGFVEGIATLLSEDGVAVIEVPHVKELIARCEFDTIHHEHLCYFSVTSLRKLFERHGLKLNDVRPLSIHGGSLRLYVGHGETESRTVQRMLAEEVVAGLDRPAGYRWFAKRVDELRGLLREELTELRRGGARIAAYGAAAKGATLINYVGIGTDLIDFAVDRNVHKHGLYMPGEHIPVVDPRHLLRLQPDYTLLLTWNFKDEILDQQAEYRRRGGRFIVPVPRVTIV